jgi:hypothetical protein
VALKSVHPPFHALSRLCADFIPAYWPNATCPVPRRVLCSGPYPRRDALAHRRHDEPFSGYRIFRHDIASTPFESFTSNAVKASKWLFFAGLRGQEVFPMTSLKPRIVQDTITGEGPMILVTGLALQDIEQETNTHLPSNAKLFVSLHNGPRAFVVNGPPRSLYGLVTNLRKICTPNGADQSKIPASQLKAVFNVRFLVIGVPFHNSEYLEGVGEKVVTGLGGRRMIWLFPCITPKMVGFLL